MNHMPANNTEVFSESLDPIEQFLAFPEESAPAEDMRYGIINMYSGSVGFIVPDYVNKKHMPIPPAPLISTIFFPKKTKILPEDIRIHTVDTVYVVRYKYGGTIVNPKTGQEQDTIDPSCPLQVLHVLARNHYARVTICEKGVLCRKPSKQTPVEPRPENAVLPDSSAAKIREQFRQILQKQPFVKSNIFPEIARSAGISNFRLYAGNVEQFLKSFLPEYILLKKIRYNNVEYPDVILPANREKKAALPPELASALPTLRGLLLEDLKLHHYIKASEFRNITQAAGIENFQLFTDTVEEFLEAWLPDYTLLPTYTWNDTEYTDVIVPAVFTDQQDKKENTTPTADLDTALETIRSLFLKTLETQLFIRASIFPAIAREAGIDNFRNYSDTVEEFIQKYMPDFAMLKNIRLKNVDYPSLIVPAANADNICAMAAEEAEESAHQSEMEEKISSFDQQTESPASRPVFVQSRKTSLQILRAMYAEQNYAGFLLSPELQSFQFYELPLDCMEMALTCAARLMFPESTETIRLNLLHKEILAAPSSMDFVRKWKRDGIYAPEILAACAESTWGSYVSPDDNGLLSIMLNRLGMCGGLPNNYFGLIKCFRSCENNILPYLFLIWACVQKTDGSVERCIQEYCQTVKTMNTSSTATRISPDRQPYCLDRFLIALQKCDLLHYTNLWRGTRVYLVSVFIDLARTEPLEELLSVLDPQQLTSEWKLLQLRYLDHCTEESIDEIFENVGSLKLIQRFVSLMWERQPRPASRQFLRVLCWISIRDSYLTLDEIIRYCFSSELPPTAKKLQLVQAYDTVITMAREDIRMYALASYIASILAVQDTTLTLLEEENQRVLERWPADSEQFRQRILEQFGQISAANEADFVKLFHIFHLDETGYNILQKQYADWYKDCCMLSERSPEECQSILADLYIKEAYGAYAELFTEMEASPDMESWIDQHTEEYIHALCCLRRYSEAVIYLQQNRRLPQSVRDEHLVTVICDSFRTYALTERAFDLYDWYFTYEDAIRLLLNHFQPTKYYIVTGLIALYFKTGELLKALYLYQIYHVKSENGFTKLYTQFRSENRFNGWKLKNHFDVIDKAFLMLQYDELVDFLVWAKQIPVPDFKENDTSHKFSFFYKVLLRDPNSPDNWRRLLQDLEKRPQLNAWELVVCSTVLSQKHGITPSTSLSQHLYSVMQSHVNSRLPYNLLPYTFLHIMNTGDTDICHTLCNLLRHEDILNQLITKNPQHPSYGGVFDAFRQYCVNGCMQTAENVYLELMELLGFTVSITEMASFTLSSSKKYLFRTLAENYHLNQNIDESIEVLNIQEWNGLSLRDMEFLNLLRMLYTDNETLAERYPELPLDSENIQRFKRDCARILSVYPHKHELFDFDRNCDNLAYKLTIYRFLFGFQYDEDIYHRYDLEYADFSRDPAVFSAYMRFLIQSYYAQLYWNSDFEFFYKKWRYLKLYIANLLLAEGTFDDSRIVKTMTDNDHYDQVYPTYVAFLGYIREFWAMPALDRDVKQNFLYSLMTGRLGSFLRQNASVVADQSDTAKRLMRLLIEQVDYREINLGFYRIFAEDFAAGNFQEALRVAQAMPSAVGQTLHALQNAENLDNSMEIFNEVALEVKPGAVVSAFLRMSDAKFTAYADLLLHILLSRQFLFHIYGRLREQIIKRKFNGLPARITLLADHFTKSGHDEGIAVCSYLNALKACVENKREKAADILVGADWQDKLPIQWKKESDRIRAFAAGKSRQFVFDRSIADNSQTRETKDTRFRFADRLKKRFPLEDGSRQKSGHGAAQPISHNQALSLYDIFCTHETPAKRIANGLELLSGYRFDRSQKDKDLPSYAQLALSLGLYITANGALELEDRMQILTELYDNRNVLRSDADKEELQILDDSLLHLISRDIPLRLWIRYADSIETFLNEKQITNKLSELKTRILGPCDALMQPEVSYDVRYEKLMALQQQFLGLDCRYSQNVSRALIHECKRIEDGVRLQIRIDNENNRLTDGYVYFQITNIGKCSVSLGSPEFSIVLMQEGFPDRENIRLEGIADLQSGFITGGRVQLVPVAESSVSVQISILRQLPGQETEILCCDSKVLERADCSAAFRINSSVCYDVDRAVREGDMLFGRENLKEILPDCIRRGITVLYGPSRIGKTSIMNWVENDCARARGNVMTVLFGGENSGRNRNYEVNFTDSTQPVPYHSEKEIAEYLLVETILAGMRSSRYFHGPATVPMPDGLRQKIAGLLQERELGIVDRYYNINDLLEAYNLELWLMLDEFQEVVEQLEQYPDNHFYHFREVCEMLFSDSETMRIKLIICGSDDLLRHMVLEDNSFWRKAFPERARIGVEPLLPEPFCNMIRQDKGIAGTNIVYSESALDALFTYTGGVALYGKEICNTILEDMNAVPARYENRNVLYASDVAGATQKLLNMQTADLTMGSRGKIRSIYDAVTKNLDTDTDMQYMWFMAQWLFNNPDKTGFPETMFEQSGTLRSRDSLKASLEITQARGIIQKKTLDGEKYYVFRTIFYYYAFLGSSRLDLSKIYLDESDEDSSRPWTDDVLDIMRQQPEVRGSDVVKIIENLQDDNLEKQLGKYYGKQINVDLDGPVINSDNIENLKIQNIQINAQIIGTAVQNLLTVDASADPEMFLSSFQQLPSLEAYLDEDNTKNKLASLRSALKTAGDEDTLLDTQNRLEALTAPAEQKMLGDTLGAMIASDNFTHVSDEQWCRLVGLNAPDKLTRIRQTLPEEFLTSLNFAVMLHNVFDQIQQKSNDYKDKAALPLLDYCPVAIMYCKVVEAMLKAMHTPIYVDKLGDCTIKMHGPVFSSLRAADGSIIPSKDLTMGSFSHPIVRVKGEKSIDKPDTFQLSPNKSAIEKIIENDDFLMKPWCRHAEALAVILAIRNRSAHEAVPITKANLDWLVKILFAEGELLNICQLIQ